MSEKIIAVVGPTAVGKTGVGLSLASRFGGEIISVDSRQVYREMDLVTGKDVPPKAVFQKRKTLTNQQGTKLSIGYYQYDSGRVWLYDVVPPRVVFSAADFRIAAHWVIRNIQKRGKVPILVGGTGFYLRAMTEGYETLGIPPDWDLRHRLESWPLVKLQERVVKEVPARWEKMNRSDRANPRRLIRAIETRAGEAQEPTPFAEVFKIGLRLSAKDLLAQIDRRVEARLRAGAEEEVKRLVKKFGWESVLGETIGYQEWRPYLEGQTSRSVVIEAWRLAEHQYAKRQLVWFRKEPALSWYPAGPKVVTTLVEKVAKYLAV